MSNDGSSPSKPANNGNENKSSPRRRSSSPHSNSITELISQNFQRTMRRAFWDLMYDQLKSSPPNLDTAFQLLSDIKQGLLGLLPRRKTTLHDRIEVIFDMETLRGQAELGAIDITDLLTKVLVLMGEMCAPARDDKLKEITDRLNAHNDTSDSARNLVTIFRAILEFIDLMGEDFRTLIRQHTNPVDVHRAQFQEYLSKGGQPLVLLAWLKTAKEELDTAEHQSSSTSSTAITTERVFIAAFTKLLVLDLQQPIAETIADEFVERVRMFSVEVKSVALLTTLVLLVKQAVSNSNCGETSAAIRGILSEVGSTEDNTIEKRLDNVMAWVLEKYGDLGEAMRRSLEKSIKEIASGDAMEKHAVLKLVVQRITSYASQCLKAALNKQPLPNVPGIASTTATHNDLGYIANDFLKIMIQNYITFEPLYSKMLAEI